MDEHFEDEIQEALAERANLEKMLAEREKKDRILISRYCAENRPADIYRTLELLNKYPGMPQHDKDVITEFKEKYPGALSLQLILQFKDVKDIYSHYLESGGEDNE